MLRPSDQRRVTKRQYGFTFVNRSFARQKLYVVEANLLKKKVRNPAALIVESIAVHNAGMKEAAVAVLQRRGRNCGGAAQIWRSSMIVEKINAKRAARPAYTATPTAGTALLPGLIGR
jgi:hypothetical protein